MATLVVFHHAQGLTDGVKAFADGLREAGHDVTVPDLYRGATFGTVDEGVAHAESLGFDRIIADGVAAADAVPAATVFAGFSLGALPAQKLAQTRVGAAACLLYHAGVPVSTFGSAWPTGVRLEIHSNVDDPWAEIDEAERLVADAGLVATAALHRYPGSSHLFADSSLADHVPESAALLMERTLDLLAEVDRQADGEADGEAGAGVDRDDPVGR